MLTFNKGLLLASVFAFLFFLLTGIIFPILLSTDKLPLWLIGIFVILISLLISIFFQKVIFKFYKKEQKANEKR